MVITNNFVRNIYCISIYIWCLRYDVLISFLNVHQIFHSMSSKDLYLKKKLHVFLLSLGNYFLGCKYSEILCLVSFVCKQTSHTADPTFWKNYPFFIDFASLPSQTSVAFICGCLFLRLPFYLIDLSFLFCNAVWLTIFKSNENFKYSLSVLWAVLPILLHFHVS